MSRTELVAYWLTTHLLGWILVAIGFVAPKHWDGTGTLMMFGGSVLIFDTVFIAVGLGIYLALRRALGKLTQKVPR